MHVSQRDSLRNSFFHAGGFTFQKYGYPRAIIELYEVRFLCSNSLCSNESREMIQTLAEGTNRICSKEITGTKHRNERDNRNRTHGSSSWEPKEETANIRKTTERRKSLVD